MEYQYDIFLSYRHRPLDSIITQKTFHMVESYRLPKSLRNQGHDIRRAFRDTEELSVSRILTDTIDKALHSTNCLLLVCSTDTPSSEWVDREVAMFIELGRAQKIYPLLISGDPETSFPPSLKKIPDIMDRVMDVRCEGNDVKKIAAKEETALLKILADATGVGYRELQREHGLRKLRRFIAKAVVSSIVFFTVGAVSLGLMHRAQTYRDQAQAAEKSSMRILQELTYGLPDRLTGVPGAYSKISGILQDNAGQINRILLLSTDKTSAEYEVAANYEKVATAMTVLGSYKEAADYQQQAIVLYETLCNADQNFGPLASARNNLGKVLSSAGQYTAAAEEFDRAIALQEPLGDPVTLATMYGNACANASEQGSKEKAEDYFSRCMALLREEPETYQTILIRANASVSSAMLHYRVGRYADAEEKLKTAIQDYDTLCQQLDSTSNWNGLLQSISNLALVLTDEGQYESAEEYYLWAIDVSEKQLFDEENTESVSSLATLYNNCGICYNMQGQFSKAAVFYGKAAQLREKIYRASGTAPDAADFAACSMNVGDNAMKSGQFDTAWQAFETGLAVYQTVEDSLSSYQKADYLAWDAYYRMVHDRAYDDALNRAISACQVQPDSVMANMILGYTCLYAGYYEDCDRLLTMIASLGGGQADMIRNDIIAQQAAGLSSDHIAEVLSLLDGDWSNES